MKRGTVRQRHTVSCPRTPSGEYAAHRCRGAWEYLVDLGRTDDGRRNQVSRGGFESKKAAAQALQRLLDDSRDGVDVETTLTVGAYLDEWLAGRRSLRPSTQKTYREHIDRHIKPRIGSVLLRDLRPRQVDALFIAVTRVRGDRQLSSATVRRIYSTLRVALNDAVKRRLISFNPASHVELPQERRDPAKVWDAGQVARFLEQTRHDDLGVAWRLVIMTGLRRGELCGLRWSDVDTARGFVHVRQAVTAVGGNLHVGPPKTRAGTRVVPLDRLTCGLLDAHKRQQKAKAEAWGSAYVASGLVLTREDGSGIRPDQVTRCFRAAARTAGLPEIRFHDLRHTSASLALSAGVPMRVVSDRLGHSTTTITADLYTHVVPSVAREAAEAIASTVASAEQCWRDVGEDDLVDGSETDSERSSK